MKFLGQKQEWQRNESHSIEIFWVLVWFLRNSRKYLRRWLPRPQEAYTRCLNIRRRRREFQVLYKTPRIVPLRQWKIPPSTCSLIELPFFHHYHHHRLEEIHSYLGFLDQFVNSQLSEETPCNCGRNDGIQQYSQYEFWILSGQNFIIFILK